LSLEEFLKVRLAIIMWTDIHFFLSLSLFVFHRIVLMPRPRYHRITKISGMTRINFLFFTNQSRIISSKKWLFLLLKKEEKKDENVKSRGSRPHFVQTFRYRVLHIMPWPNVTDLESVHRFKNVYVIIIKSLGEIAKYLKSYIFHSIPHTSKICLETRAYPFPFLPRIFFFLFPPFIFFARPRMKFEAGCVLSRRFCFPLFRPSVKYSLSDTTHPKN